MAMRQWDVLMHFDRRTVLRAGFTAAAAATMRFAASQSTAPGGGYAGIFPRLDEFVEQYMRDKCAPGMTLVLADRDGVQRVVTYGLGDVERGSPVRSDDLFQIGSISKSFVALCLLQLHDEGKLDFHKPITDYLPWFRVDSKFAPITVHHLLTHGSGLPGDVDVFLSDSSQRHRAANSPGEYFHYSNMAFALLGYLAWTLDGRELPELLRKRILEPLGMTQTQPMITLDMRGRFVKSYAPFQNDRLDACTARLCEAPGIIDSTGAGCIASTARDMGAYVRMLANGGVGPYGRLVSKESFALFSRAHVDAREFGPTASYGYGIAVDTLDGNTVVRHTGGMLSFASSILVDIDDGVGAFASINAMQGYRPTPVVQFAVRLMRARRASKVLPAVPAPSPPWRIANARDYEGIYQDAADRRLVIVRDEERLFWQRETERIVLEAANEPDRFIVVHADFGHFPLVFSRQSDKDPQSAVTEAAWGSEWYAGASYDGPRQFIHPQPWESYLGHYRNESPWIGSLRVVLRKGQLWLDGVIPLAPEGDVFYLRDEDHSPEWIRFGEIVNGRCMRLKFSGVDLWRVAAT
jgi:CubicO group peptidase (beta-lactamase class C family)